MEQGAADHELTLLLLILVSLDDLFCSFILSCIFACFLTHSKFQRTFVHSKILRFTIGQCLLPLEIKGHKHTSASVPLSPKIHLFYFIFSLAFSMEEFIFLPCFFIAAFYVFILKL